VCGIVGEVRFDASSADVGALQRGCNRLAPRGPDGSGIFALGPVGLGHRRLSIIDLSPAGSQPMVDADLGLAIVFNGCIYNYPTLRDELASLGHRFLLSLRHRGGAQGIPGMGNEVCRAFQRDVRLRGG
jgi:asparagine synthase (glutamine-hydrolysing)